MLEPDFNNLDGEVVGFDIAAPVPGKKNPFDQDNFYPADGKRMKKGGLKSELQRRRALREDKSQQRQTRRNTRVDSSAAARQMRGQSKLGQSKAQILASKGLLKDTSSTNAPLVDPNFDPNAPTTGLSKNAKIGIAIVAGVVVLAVAYKLLKGGKSGK